MKKIIASLLAFALSAPAVWAEPFEHYINDAFESGIISGDENGNFDAEKTATRGEFAQITANFLGLEGGGNIFSDVLDEDWFSDGICALNSAGIMYGYTDGTLRPYEPVSYEDAVTVIGRYYRQYSKKATEIENVSEYAKKYFSYAAENAFLDNNNPKRYITKGEILALLYKYEENNENTVHFLKGYPKISDKGLFNNITVELRASCECDVYYAVTEAGKAAKAPSEKLCTISAKNMTVTVNIVAGLDKEYDLYLKAVAKDGTQSRVAVLENVNSMAYAAGTGDISTPYVIYTEYQLKMMESMPDKAYKLGADVAVCGEWEPIPIFSGSFDGNGFKITGMTVNRNAENAGLFAVLEKGAEIKNLSIEGKVNSKGTSGVISGVNYGEITNCCVWGNLSANNNSLGGICGQNYGNISDCLSAVSDISCGAYAGGICGQNYGNICECISAANEISADMYASGIAGINSGGKITDCVCACGGVFNNMTTGGGRITTNRRKGITENNYCYEDMLSNSEYEELGIMTSSGEDIAWEEIVSGKLASECEWNSAAWRKSDNGYRIICPAGCKAPDIEKGSCAYMPAPVSSAAELMNINKNESGHYLITRDITLNAPWKAICTRDGFSGSLDGGGHIISGLKLQGETAMFSNITGGTLRNLNIINAAVSSGAVSSVLTACNYGKITGCTVRGQASLKKNTVFGGIAAENFGEVTDCSVYIEIDDASSQSTVGGICGDNSGIADNCYASLKLSSHGENTIVGGICGSDNGGYIFEGFSNMSVSADNKSAYVGGICGSAENTTVYKCGAAVNSVMKGGTVRAGGICAAQRGGSIYNAYSVGDIYTVSKTAYAGGIAGSAESGNIQNTYSAISIVAAGTEDVCAAGICGEGADSVIMQNVSLNPSVSSTGNAGRIAAKLENCDEGDNYICRATSLSGYSINPENCLEKSLSALKNTEFYFKPLSDGGLLGWENTVHGGDVWQKGTVQYPFPILCGVRGQQNLKMPKYLKR